MRRGASTDLPLDGLPPGQPAACRRLVAEVDEVSDDQIDRHQARPGRVAGVPEKHEGLFAVADALPRLAQPPQCCTEPFVGFGRGLVSQRRLEVSPGRLPIACGQGRSTPFELVCAHHPVRVLMAVRLWPP